MQEIQNVSDEIRAKGGQALPVPTDVTREDDVDSLVTQAQKELGQVDILVNNAAIIHAGGLLLDTDISAWRRLFEVNVIGVVRCMRAVLSGMIERRSSKIIIVGSLAGWSDEWARRCPEQIAYATSKAAVMHLSACPSSILRSFSQSQLPCSL